VLQPTLKSGEKVAKPDIEEKDMQFLYEQGGDFYFMDTRNYEQTFISAEVLGESKNFLKENINASILFYNGKAIGVTLPNSVDLKVTKCDPGVRGDTVSGALKPATMETGYTVNVPLFINEGDILKIDTRDGKYLTRVATAG
jgi:elongation factor P